MAEAKHFRLLGAWLDLIENRYWLAFYSILHELAIDIFTGPTISPLDERKQQKHRSNQVNLARRKQAAEAKRNYHFVAAPTRKYCRTCEDGLDEGFRLRMRPRIAFENFLGSLVGPMLRLGIRDIGEL